MCHIYSIHLNVCPKQLVNAKLEKAQKNGNCVQKVYIVDFKNFSVKEVVSKNVCLNLIKVN